MAPLEAAAAPRAAVRAWNQRFAVGSNETFVPF
jgi:hypothetical protein